MAGQRLRRAAHRRGRRRARAGAGRSGVASVLSTASSAPAACASPRQRGDVDDVEGRVRRRLDPHERRAVERGADRLLVGRHEPHLDAARREVLACEDAHARVAVGRRDEHVAGAEGQHDRARRPPSPTRRAPPRRPRARPARSRSAARSGCRSGCSRRARRPGRRAGGTARRAPARAGTARPARGAGRPAWTTRVASFSPRPLAGGEAAVAVRAVAERLDPRLPAAAQGDRLARRQLPRVARRRRPAGSGRSPCRARCRGP